MAIATMTGGRMRASLSLEARRFGVWIVVICAVGCEPIKARTSNTTVSVDVSANMSRTWQFGVFCLIVVVANVDDTSIRKRYMMSRDKDLEKDKVNVPQGCQQSRQPSDLKTHHEIRKEREKRQVARARAA